jgi:hypothetical protein
MAIILTTDRGVTVQKPCQRGALTLAQAGFAGERPSATSDQMFLFERRRRQVPETRTGRTGPSSLLVDFYLTFSALFISSRFRMLVDCINSITQLRRRGCFSSGGDRL